MQSQKGQVADGITHEDEIRNLEICPVFLVYPCVGCIYREDDQWEENNNNNNKLPTPTLRFFVWLQGYNHHVHIAHNTRCFYPPPRKKTIIIIIAQEDGAENMRDCSN